MTEHITYLSTIIYGRQRFVQCPKKLWGKMHKGKSASYCKLACNDYRGLVNEDHTPAVRKHDGAYPTECWLACAYVRDRKMYREKEGVDETTKKAAPL